MRNSKVTIPKVLHEFHGTKASIPDLILTYLAACIAASVVYFFIPADFVLWKQIMLILLALDIGGGVVANFTEGTTRYHENNPKLRLFFIAPLHLVHPAILVILFPTQMGIIAINATLIIACTYSVNAIKGYKLQKAVAPLLLLLVIAINIVSQIPDPIISFLLILLAVKLILAYAVRWKT
ncbi:hypothetical protein [Fodinibius salsisoli]|uniref:Uncharacterized protein n=1 Tax=Fodinibius salsisoli TaxID=2820877 RepID=A0ABT3PKJ5_9BACT|nr:hypothetical protein [Fodinibius salsisoli]MCW9705729.1 hypothetical protein [Fodinibius salsisoli]